MRALRPGHKSEREWAKDLPVGKSRHDGASLAVVTVMHIFFAAVLVLFLGPCTVYGKNESCEKRLEAPHGLPEDKFYDLLTQIKSDPLFENVLCLVFFGSRAHLQRGYPPTHLSDLDVMFFKVNPRLKVPDLNSIFFKFFGNLEWARILEDPFHIGTASGGDMYAAVFPPEELVAEYKSASPVSLRNYLFGPMPFFQEMSFDEYSAGVRTLDREARDNNLDRKQWRQRHIELTWPSGLVDREARFVFLRTEPRIDKIISGLNGLGYFNIWSM